MKVEWNNEDRYFIKEKLPNGQTFYMNFDDFDGNDDKEVVYWNIALSIYSKRKHADMNENLAKMTGKDPMLNVITAIKAFKLLEKSVLSDEKYQYWTNIIIVTWVDTKRRDTYYKFLSKYGYDWGMYDGHKVIMKVVPPKVEEGKDVSV